MLNVILNENINQPNITTLFVILSLIREGVYSILYRSDIIKSLVYMNNAGIFENNLIIPNNVFSEMELIIDDMEMDIDMDMEMEIDIDMEIENNNLEISEIPFLDMTPEHPVVTAFALCFETQDELVKLEECVICREEKKKLEFDVTNCNHEFCHSCLLSYMNKKGVDTLTCPMCREPITSLAVKDPENYTEIQDLFSTTACLLKDSMVATFGKVAFQMWCEEKNTIEDMIYVLLENYNNEELKKNVDNAETEEERAKIIHCYVYLYTYDEVEINMNINDTTIY